MALFPPHIVLGETALPWALRGREDRIAKVTVLSTGSCGDKTPDLEAPLGTICSTCDGKWWIR